MSFLYLHFTFYISLPGFSPIPSPVPDLKPEFVDLASFLSGLLNIVFFIAVFLAFYWLVWGAFQYMMARGEKENLQKARERIKWAIIGLLVVIIAYLIATFAGEIFPSRPSPGASPIPGGGLF